MIELNGSLFGEMMQSYGGDTLNAAVYLNRMNSVDIQTHYVSALGCDAASQAMLQHWQQEGISTEMVLSDPERTPGLYMIQVDDSGERSFLYWRAQSAAKFMLQHPQFTQIKESLKKMDMIFLSGISLAILSDIDRQALILLLNECKREGVEIAFDSNFRPALWPHTDNHICVKDIYDKVFRICDVALVTFDDEQLVWKDKDHHSTLARLKESGVKKAIIKMGSSGCIVQNFECDIQASTILTESVQNVIDTTSAGDSFNGGFLASYLRGESLKTACHLGNKLAGLVIQYRGAIIPKMVTDTLNQTIEEYK